MKATLLIFTFLLIGDLYSQSVNDFQDLIAIFNQGNDTEIPNSLAKKYFGFIPNTDPHWGDKTLHVKEIVFQTENFIGLSAYSDCGAGGICRHTDLLIFTIKGEIIDRLNRFELDLADCSFMNIKYCSYYSDSLLIVVKQNTSGDCIEDTLFSNIIQIENLNISKSGRINRGLTQAIDTRRKYYTLSTDLLRSKDLVDKSKNELAVMRNEIFAAHGYRFRTEKWINYFSSKVWYNPKFDNVDDKLTEIEKRNIELILKSE